MQRFKSILVYLSGEPGDDAALARAARLARCNGSALKLVGVVEDFPWYTRLLLPASSEMQSVLVTQKQEHLEACAEEFRKEGIAVNTKVLRGQVPLQLVHEVLKAGHDLVMKVVKSDGDNLIGATEMHLMRNCSCPVWLVQSSQTLEPYRRILAAVDPVPALDGGDVLNLEMDTGSRNQELNAK